MNSECHETHDDHELRGTSTRNEMKVAAAVNGVRAMDIFSALWHVDRVGGFLSVFLYVQHVDVLPLSSPRC